MGKLIPILTFAKALPSYKLKVVFNDGISGIIDLEDWKGRGVFKYWEDEENFKKFSITKNRKVAWSEDIDMDPDSWYLKLINKTFDEYANNK